MDKHMLTPQERAALDRLDAARRGLSEVWSLIRKRNRTVEDKEAIVRANVEMETATKRMKRMLVPDPAPGTYSTATLPVPPQAMHRTVLPVRAPASRISSLPLPAHA